MRDRTDTLGRPLSHNLRPANDGQFLNRSAGGYVSGSQQNGEVGIARPLAFEVPRCHFEVFRADEVMVTSTRLAGGDWRWRLCDQDGIVLVEADGYQTEQRCRSAVAILQARAGNAPVSAPSHHPGEQ